MTATRSSARRIGTGIAMLLALSAVFSSSIAHAQGAANARRPPSASDREAIRRAVLDYVEGFYEGDSTKLVRALRPEFYKYGFYFSPDSAKYRGMRMSWQAAMNFARRVKETNDRAKPGSPKEIVVFDVADQTASAKLTAYWGIDYLLLGKFDGQWMISHVLWQSPPPAP